MNCTTNYSPATAQNAATQYTTPAVNVVETKDQFVLEAEMPGVPKDGLEVSVEDRTLTLVGRRPARSAEVSTLYREITPRDFKRVFELDATIDTARISARIEQGLLRVTLPKVEAVKPRKISVVE